MWTCLLEHLVSILLILSSILLILHVLTIVLVLHLLLLLLHSSVLHLLLVLLLLLHHHHLLCLLWSHLLLLTSTLHHWLLLLVELLLLLMLWLLSLSFLLLAHHHSLLSLGVKHSIAFNVREVAHVALLSERVVVVEASLASPVSHGILLLDAILLSHCVVNLLVELSSWLVLGILSGQLRFCLFVFHLSDVFWLSIVILCILGFFASEAFGSSLEVVVVAHAAFPSSIWESKFFRVLLFSLFFFSILFLEICFWRMLMVKRSDTSSKLGNDSKLSFLTNSWFLLYDLLERLKEKCWFILWNKHRCVSFQD